MGRIRAGQQRHGALNAGANVLVEFRSGRINEFFISAGAQACLVSLLSSIARPGEPMLIEPWSYPTMRLIARQLGLELRPLEADQEGILPDSFEKMAARGDAKLLYVVPTLHNPTTVTLSGERRHALAETARRHDVKIVEDDVFRYLADEAPPTICSLAPERTYYIQSVSKTMAAGLRIGFMALPQGSAGDIVRQQMIIGGRPVSLSLEVARRWIEAGIADRILSRIRGELLARRAVALDVCLAQPSASLAAGRIRCRGPVERSEAHPRGRLRDGPHRPPRCKGLPWPCTLARSSARRLRAVAPASRPRTGRRIPDDGLSAP